MFDHLGKTLILPGIEKCASHTRGPVQRERHLRVSHKGLILLDCIHQARISFTMEMPQTSCKDSEFVSVELHLASDARFVAYEVTTLQQLDRGAPGFRQQIPSTYKSELQGSSEGTKV